MSTGARIAAPQRTLLIVSALSLLAIAVFIPVFRLQQIPWSQAIPAAVVFVVSCVLLGWVTWHILVQQRHVGSPGHAMVTHLLTGSAFTILWTASFTGFVYVVRPDSMAVHWREGGVWQLVWGVVLYGALAAAAHIQRQRKEQEIAAASAELQALRAQLHPHFLFNTLHSLTQLVREDPIATQNALERFGRLMRYVLNAGRDAATDVPLEDEIAFVRDYLALEHLRMGERLRVTEDIDADALEVAVPPLLLQPLVENAVRHGLAPRREGGTIQLKARVAGSALVLEVADDGSGAEPDSWSRSAGLGLQAVRRQLSVRVHGGTLEVDTRPGAGFTARIGLAARVPAVIRRWRCAF